jgi:hypothetical protein
MNHAELFRNFSHQKMDLVSTAVYAKEADPSFSLIEGYNQDHREIGRVRRDLDLHSSPVGNPTVRGTGIPRISGTSKSYVS